MSANYYNAIVVLAGGKRIRFNDITNVRGFVGWCENNKQFTTIMFYRKWARDFKEGSYVGFYSTKKGFSFTP